MIVHLDGWDGETLSFAVRSETTPALWYEIELNADSGKAICGLTLEPTDEDPDSEWEVLRGCLDRKFRKRVGNMDRPANPCKHIAEALRRVRLMIAMNQNGASGDELAAMIDDRFKGFLA